MGKSNYLGGTMRNHPARIHAIVATAAVAAISLSAQATVYTDSTGDNWAPAATYVDIASVEMTNDATNLTIKLNVNSSADLTNASQQYGIYELGFQFKPGGQTLINGDYSGTTSSGNPYGTPVGFGSGNGNNTFIGLFTSGGGGGDAYTYDATTGWTHTYNAFQQADRVSLTPNTITAVIPFSLLGMTAGTTFKFDAWSTFSGDNSAYDALDNPTMTFSGSSRLPYNGGSSAAPYDSMVETPAQFAATTYTITSGSSLSGDINGDGIVNIADFNILAANYGATGTTLATGDINGDGVTNLLDLNAIATNFGKSSSAPIALGAVVPEPSTFAAIAGLTGLFAARRSRRNRCSPNLD
jgi:hypothetical protein